MLLVASVCISTLFVCGCETWTTCSGQIKLLAAFQIKCLQHILGITWSNRVPHIEVLKRTECNSIEATVIQHQLHWLRHIIQIIEKAPTMKDPFRATARGPTCGLWSKEMLQGSNEEIMKKSKINSSNLKNSPTNHPLWRTLCHDGLQHFESTRICVLL